MKRRCRRCKTLWDKPKGDRKHTCLECRSKCIRCNVPLTEKNISTSNRKQYCKACNSEINKLSSQRPEFKLHRKDYNLMWNFAITLPEYEAILKHQNDVCAICKRVPTGRRLAVDHKHVKQDSKTSAREKRFRVRGLLCWQCNAAIGKFQDNPDLLRAAAEYLENPPAKKVISNGT